MAAIENFSEAEKRGHEQVVYFYYPDVGLKAIVAIHSTVLGPALGGCRMRLYETESDALNDVMRLSEGMTYKNSVAGLDLGGGKACVIADSAMKKGREDLFTKFGECLNNLCGRYISAEDMGTSVQDVMCMKRVSKFLSGTAMEHGGGGDPSPWTALGVFRGILAACEIRYGSKDLKNKRVWVQGVGHVGKVLADLLYKAGAKLIVSDINGKNIQGLTSEIPAEVLTSEEGYSKRCDIYSPCAVGQTVNNKTLETLNCDIIAGAANNQLSGSEVYDTIRLKNILYCPDFVINAGGVINCASETRNEGWSEAWTREKVENIYNTVHIAKERIEAARRR